MSKQAVNETTHLFARIGARTERGGSVARVSTNATDPRLAAVSDIVAYEDGTESTIMDGAGGVVTREDRPVALVGSHLSNGDRIVTAAQNAFGITVRDGDAVPGLFDSAYSPISADAVRTGGHRA